MDPTANLAMQRGQAARILALNSQGSTSEEMSDQIEELMVLAVDLAEHAQALDDWLSNGGFKPDDWTAGEDFELTDTGVLGIIQLADGTQSRFAIHGDGTWIQWGAPPERLGRTVDLLDDINSKFWEQEG